MNVGLVTCDGTETSIHEVLCGSSVGVVYFTTAWSSNNADMLGGIASMADLYYPKGARTVLVLMEDSKGNPATTASCATFASKYKVPLDKIVVAIDPGTATFPYYSGLGAVSALIVASRFSVITVRDGVETISPVKGIVKMELVQMCAELGDPPGCPGP